MTEEKKKPEKRGAIIVGISGASSSGKTTLARLLRDVFPNTFILHEDDFYRPETELPMKDGLLDWDCAEALNIPDMTRALEHIRAEGTFPPFVDSKEDQNSIGACPVSAAKLAAMKAKVAAWLAPGQPGHALITSSSSSSPLTNSSSSSPPPRICLLDGFLLYAPPADPATATAAPLRTVTTSLLDVRLFLLVGRAQATRRREARDGYVTLEGFWTDPPGYVDKVVWPNYVASHAWLFERGDVEAGVLDERVLAREGILAPPRPPGEEGPPDMESTFEWAVEVLMRRLEEELGAR
ncbi:P-loop containing nucleoside triphosphate hydrolase protein [Biscogniauxia sp. FL1348]|nr:P-loop containing nucleoside triphosphate hydrolase protein [Biscogniauxia sp. FL1348]